MTGEREAHLIRQLRGIRSAAELEGFRAQIRDQGEAITPDLLRAIEYAASRVQK